MPFQNKYKFNHESKSTNQEKKTGAIGKSILRNVEVPILNRNADKRDAEFYSEDRRSGARRKDSVKQQMSSEFYHEPTINHVVELHKELEEIKLYEARTLESVHDLTKNSQCLANREVNRS